MQWLSHHIDYKDTDYFQQIILDYIHQNDGLLPFINSFPSIEGIQDAIMKRKHVNTNREELVAHLRHQYQQVNASDKVLHSISKLSEESTFTITTAHQPNLLTGPLYFIYKIAHAIKLAAYCNAHIPNYNFVPVYYMGMEDADFLELNHFTVQGKKYVWETSQSGAFGKMKVDQAFIQLLNQLESQIASLPHAISMMLQLRRCFTEGKTIAAATFEFIHHLFERYGLVVLMPDSNALKSLLQDVMKDDLMNHTAHSILEEVKSTYPYPNAWQANPRPINLFYFKDNIRERIELQKERYQVLNSDISFSKGELLDELEQHPERFSPNVIIRPLLQEILLPNLVYIGGAGELSYWLQLKKIFDHYHIPYPVLMLRSSFILMTDKQHNQWAKLGFNMQDIFKSAEELLAAYVKCNTKHTISFEEEKRNLEQQFDEIGLKATNVDITLKAHVAALHRNLQKKILELEKKMLRAEKRRFEEAARQIAQLTNNLFPDKTLQERKEGMMGFYATWGAAWIDQIVQHIPIPEQKMTVLTYPLSY